MYAGSYRLDLWAVSYNILRLGTIATLAAWRLQTLSTITVTRFLAQQRTSDGCQHRPSLTDLPSLPSHRLANLPLVT